MGSVDNKLWRRALLIGVLLGAVTLALFWPVTRYDFVKYDDPDYVTDNPHVRGGLTWANVVSAFRTPYAGNWHPLTWLSHMLDVQLFGLNPGWHHLTSVLFHAANSMLLLLLLARMTGALWPSVFVAALFALHPLHVESVAWIAERKDVLSTFFFLLTLAAYVRYAQESTVHRPRSEGRNPKAETRKKAEIRNPKSEVRSAEGTAEGPHSPVHCLWSLVSGLWYLLALGFFTLGLMSKSMLVTLPFVLLLLDYWPLRRLDPYRGSNELHETSPSPRPTGRGIKGEGPAWRLVQEKLPFFGLAFASSLVTFLVQQQAGAVGTLEAFPLGFRVSNALIAYVRYIGKLLWPAKLAVFYPAPKEWPLAWAVGAALFLAVVSFLALARARKAPYLLVGWCWFLGTLVPVIGLVQVGLQAMADRYSYIPSIGLCIALVWFVSELKVCRPAAARLLPALGLATLIGCLVLTRQQLASWKDNLSLFAHALAVTRDNAVAHNNLGVSLQDQGDLAAAQSHFSEAIRLQPDYAEALLNLGICATKQGRDQEALELFEKSLRLRSVCLAHYNLAKMLAQLNRPQEAEPHYLAALEIKPEFAEARYNLGELRARQGRNEEAARDYTAALQLKPDDDQAHLSLGALLAGEQRFDEAIVHFQAALRSSPENADAHFNLASAFRSKGNLAEAAAQYAEACRLRPGDLEARQNLGVTLLFEGKPAEALPQLQEILRARPNAAAHYYTALALDAQGRPEEALAHYREAVNQEPQAPLYLNDLAWLLATQPNPKLRNGVEAVRFAEAACQLAGGKEARFCGTLDAAYAEAGRFGEAITTATKARDLAMAAGQSVIAQAAEQRLALYRRRQPYHTPAAPATGH